MLSRSTKANSWKSRLFMATFAFDNPVRASISVKELAKVLNVSEDEIKDKMTPVIEAQETTYLQMGEKVLSRRAGRDIVIRVTGGDDSIEKMIEDTLTSGGHPEIKQWFWVKDNSERKTQCYNGTCESISGSYHVILSLSEESDVETVSSWFNACHTPFVTGIVTPHPNSTFDKLVKALDEHLNPDGEYKEQDTDYHCSEDVGHLIGEGTPAPSDGDVSCIKPCPLCGALPQTHIYPRKERNSIGLKIRCEKCGLSVKGKLYGNNPNDFENFRMMMDGLTEEWNSLAKREE